MIFFYLPLFIIFVKTEIFLSKEKCLEISVKFYFPSFNINFIIIKILPSANKNSKTTTAKFATLSLFSLQNCFGAEWRECV